MGQITEFKILQFQLASMDHVRATGAEIEELELDSDDDLGFAVQAEIAWTKESTDQLTGTFACSVQTSDHAVHALVEAGAVGLSTREDEPEVSQELKNRMFSLMYPHLRNLMVNIGRVADLPIEGVPLTLNGLVDTDRT